MNAFAQSPLRRFVTDGLHDTINSYTTATLPLHRFAWELGSRLDMLSELTGLPHYRTLAALRTAHRVISGIDAELRAAGRNQLTAEEDHFVASAVTTLRTGLAQLDSPDPVDPIDSVHPRPVLIELLAHRHVRRTALSPVPRPVVA